VSASEEPTARRRARGALEQEVLTCLAAAGRAMTPAEVLQELDDRLAYTTVMTTLSRLHEKGVLRRDQDAVRAVTIAHKMRRLLDAGDDRAGVLAHFVADLRPEDERLLTSLLGSVDAPDRPSEPRDAGPDRADAHLTDPESSD
jgi:predicted transcriptional regulator